MANYTVSSASQAQANSPKALSQTSSNEVASRVEATLDVTESLVAAAPDTSVTELSVVIPVYNEPETVLTIVERVRALPVNKEIIVVNDGSTDNTSDSLQQLKQFADVTVVEHQVNQGKGAALQTGFELAQGQFVIVQDADLEYDPADILKVLEPLKSGEAQVVYGSRYLENALQDPSWLHRFGNWALTTFSNLMTGHRLTDMETCYKAFQRPLLQSMAIEQKRFGFEPEITAKLAQRKISIQEVPISYSCRSREEGKKIGYRDLLNALYCIIRYRFR